MENIKANDMVTYSSTGKTYRVTEGWKDVENHTWIVRQNTNPGRTGDVGKVMCVLTAKLSKN